MRRLRNWIAARLSRPSNALALLAACLLAWDHHWSQLTLGGFSLAVGAFLVRKAGV